MIYDAMTGFALTTFSRQRESQLPTRWLAGVREGMHLSMAGYSDAEGRLMGFLTPPRVIGSRAITDHLELDQEESRWHIPG